MKQLKKNKKVTIDDLAIMVAKGFDRVEEKLSHKIDTEISKVKVDIKDLRHDILNLGDRFVSFHAFDSLSHRVKILEAKKK